MALHIGTTIFLVYANLALISGIENETQNMYCMQDISNVQNYSLLQETEPTHDGKGKEAWIFLPQHIARSDINKKTFKKTLQLQQFFLDDTLV